MVLLGLGMGTGIQEHAEKDITLSLDGCGHRLCSRILDIQTHREDGRFGISVLV